MNKTYKVIYNRTRCMYQVVSELAKGRTKSETPEMLKTVFSKHGSLTRGIVMAVLSMSLAMPVGVAVQADDARTSATIGDTTTSDTTGATTTNESVTVEDGATLTGSGAATVSSTTSDGKNIITISVPTNGTVKEDNMGLVTGGTVYTAITDANETLSNKIGTLSSNLSTLDTQVKTNATTMGTLSDGAVKYDTDSNKGKVTLAGKDGTTITNVKDGAVSNSSTDAVTGKQLYNVSNRIGTLDTDGTYIKMEGSVSSNLSALDTQVKTNAGAITNNASDISTEVTNRTDADTALSNRIGTLDANGNYIKMDGSVSSNLSTLDTQINQLQTSTTNSLATKADVNASNLASLSDDELTAWGSALGKKGSISQNSNWLVTGGTIYNELMPTGTVYYIGSAVTTAERLTTLDNTLKTFADQLGVDLSSNTNLANLLYKYYKVNPEITTNADTTKTYAPDAAANGKNSVAIGPSAQAGDKSTDATTSTTTVTGGTSSTAIGDSAKANGDKSVALGYGSEVLNASGSTTAVSGSTAIGNGAKVKGGSDSTALGSGATVDTASDAMALGTGATINKTAASGVAIGNGAVTGSADKTITVKNLSYDVKAAGGEDSVAIGTDASSAGNTSLALGKGATVENDSDGSYQAVVKSDDIAVGTGAKTTASDASTAIGKGSSVTQSTDALAVGSGAKVTTSKNAMAFGKGADAESAADSIAMGTGAKTISADTIAIGQNTSAEGANSVVIGKGAVTTDEGGNAIGTGSAASGSSTAIGQSATANNYNALAIGNNATANADKSISLGYNAGVGTSEGKGETQNAGSLIAIGTSAGNNVSGMQNVAIGESAGSNVKSSYNIAIGTQAGYGINYASDNKVQNGYNVSIGYKANYQENAADIMYATALGNEANASNYAVAIGDGAKASGTNSLALGYSAQASDAESMALGHNASAADGNVAIGNGSLAPAVSSLGTVKDGYVYQSTTSTDSSGAATTTLTELKSAFTYKPLASDSHYISVGTTELTRRISNVADGVFASDAATVGQLNSLNELLQATNTTVGLTKDYFERKFTDLNTTIDASKTHYFSISESSDNLSANKDNTGATSNKADAMAIGPNANATNVKSLAVGNNVYATGLHSIAIGTAPNPTKDSAGTTTTHNTSAEGENSIALGTSTTAQADNSVAIGTRAQTYTTDTTSNTGVSSVAIGNLATTAGNQSVALGYDATVKYNYGTAIGAEALASGNDAVAIGKGSKAYSTDSTAIGQGNSITGNNVYGLGSSNAVSGKWGAVTQSGISGYKNTVTSVSDQDTTNALTGVYMTGSSNTLNQNVKYNVMQDITVQGSSNTIDGGAGGTSGHPNTLSQIAILGSSNTVQGKSSDDSMTNNIKNVTILGYNNKVDANMDTTVDFSNTQILGNNVTATLGNSVYLGNKAAYVQPTSPASDAITAARTAADTAAEASDEYKAAATDEAKVQIKAEYEAKYLYKLRVQAMEGNGTTAGMNSYDTDETYGNGTSYTYAGSNPTGVITVGSVGSEHRIQNVAAGLVSATSTDAVNGSQLYALTRQIRFGGDNSSFGTTTADDKNVVARGSNETIAITGGSDAVTTSTTDGNTTYTVDAKKLTDNNIAVIADTDNEALHVQLASNLKNLNTAQLGSGSGDSYKETIKLDGTGANGGTLALKDASGANGVTIRTSGTAKTADVTGTETSRLLVNDKTVATTDDGLKFGGDTGNVSALKLNNKLNVKGGADTTKLTDNNIGVVSDGSGTLTVKLSKNVDLGTDGSLTTGTVTATTVNATTVKTGDSTLTTSGLSIANGPSVLTSGINAGNKKITSVTAGETDTDAANYGQVKAAKTTLTAQGSNVTITPDTTSDDKHTNYTVSVSNLSYKAGTDTTAKNVTLSNGLTFQNGKNTTAVAGDNGTITYNLNDKIELGAETDSNNHIVVDGTQGLLTLGMDATINGNAGIASIGGVSIGKSGSDQVITGLTNKTWTVGTTQAVDGRAATENQLQSVADNLNTANTNIATLQHGFKVQANGDTTTESTVKADDALNFTAGDNTNVTTTKDSKQITISVDNLSVKNNNGTAQSVKLADGLNFQDGTNTMAVVGTNGSVTYDLKSSITLGTSTDEANRIIVNGTNGTITVGNLATINGNAGTASIGGVSIGKSGSDQTVTGLSNRTWVVGESTAVNGRAATEDQLQSVSNAAYTNANNITILQQGFTVTTNNDTDKKSTVKAGDNLNFQAGKNVQISTTADSKSIEVALSGTPEFTTVTSKDASGNTTIVSSTGVTITPNGTGTQSVSLTSEGLDNGNHVIKNVASGGTERTNAANIGDLQDAISNASTTATNTGFKVKGDDATSQTVKLGKQLNVVGGTNDTSKLSDGNIGVVTTDDGQGNATLTVKLNKNITLDSVTTGSTTLNTSGVSNGDMSLTNTGFVIKNNDASKQVSITTSGVSMGSQQIKNVADGTDAKDAVNKGQLDAVQTQVTNGWQIAGSNGQKVADIGAGKKVTFGDTTYATASVQPDGTDGAKVTYTINTAEITDNAKTGVVTAPTTDGVATAQNVAQAINNAAWKIKANDNEATAIKAGTTVRLKAGNNLTLSQSDTDFTYALNDELTGIKSLTTAAQDGVTTTLAASGVTIASSGTGNKSVSLTANGLNNGGKQITDVASGGDTDTNAANISDVKRLVQASASGTTETGFNVKGDDATAQKVKLGKQLNVIGGTNKAEELSDNNIGVVTTADAEGNATLTVKLNKDITLDSVTTGSTTLNTSGVSNGDMSLTNTGLVIKNNDASKQVSVTTSGVSMGSQRIQNVADATRDTDAATLKQVKNARTVVAGGSNVAGVTPAEGANNQMTYTVNVDNLSVKANSEEAKSVMLKNGLTFNDGTNTTASVGEGGVVSFGLKPEISLTKVTTGSSALDTNGLTIKEGSVTKVAITSGNVTMGGNVIHNVGAGVASTDAVNKGQLEALQNQVSGGWNLVGKNSDGTAVTAKIGAGKTVTYTDGAYTKSVVTKGDDDSDNATVKVDVTTGTLTVGADGRITSANGLATTGDVANAINSASVNVVADNTPDNKTSVKAGDTIHFAKDDNLTLTQDGTKFTYGLNKEISISKVTTSDTTNGSTVQDAKGITTTDAAGNTYIQNGQGITLTPKTPEAGKTAVILSNKGLNNGGNVISGVGAGSADTDAVNVAQLKEVNDKVGSGWQIAGNDGQKVADIGAGKKVSFKTDSQYLTADTKTAGTDAANVTYGLKTKTLTAADGKVSAVDTAEDGLATAKNVAETINQTYWTAASGKSGSGSQTDETANPVDKQISAGDTVTFNAGNNLSLVQNGASFTYGLQADLTGMNTITFTPKNDAEGHPVSLVIGKQKDGVSTNEGYYITGLDNTSWNQSNYVKNRAATEAQLADAIKQVTLASQSGGFKLSDDNNKEVSQVLGQAIGVVGDSNITTTAETTTTDTNGHIKVRLNKDINLGADGSLQAGGVTLKNNSVTVGTDGVMISSSGTERTVSNLSNTQWDTAKANQEASAGGYIGSTKAATESQLQQAISQVTTTAQNNEQHIQTGEYTMGKNLDGTDREDSHSVAMDVVNGQGEKQGSVVIKDVAKASEVGDVSQLHDTLKNSDGTKNVTGAINNLDDRVTGLDTRMDQIYTTAGQHFSVSAEDNIQVDSQSKNSTGGTDYKLSLNKEKIDLKNVTIEGNAGAVTAKTVTAEKYNVGDKTYISSDGLNANSQKITNVADGSADTDAVNVKQVNDLAARQGEAIAENAAHIGELGRAVNKLGNRLNRVGAGAAALAALHPGTYDPNDKWDFSAGIGHYHDANAVAIGAYYHPNDTTILSIGGSMGGGENMVNAGITWKMGRSGHEQRAAQPVVTHPVQAAPVVQQAAPARPAPVATPAPVVTPAPVTTPVPVKAVVPAMPAPAVTTTAMTAAPSGDTAALTQILARQTAILEKLAQNQSQAARPTAVAHGDDIFPDVPENHWAYAYVAKLEKAGALKGFKRPAVLKSPMMTRDDFASVLYTAMANGATTNPALNGDDSLNRLAQEFKAELKDVKP